MSPLVTVGAVRTRHYYAGRSSRIRGWVDLRCYSRCATARIVRLADGRVPDCGLCRRLGPVEVSP